MMPDRIEIIAIGNELLKGITVNTNAAEISRALFTNGYQCCQHLALPDDRELIKKQLQESLKRSRIVIATGGLGPTCDDITRQVAAEVFDSGFTFNEELACDLKKRYGNFPISLDNQATVPTKASLLKNPLGTAAGFVFRNEAGALILMPGVPKEMHVMLYEQVIPYLKTNFPNPTSPLCRAVHFFNVSESLIDPSLRDLERQYPNVQFGIYPAHGLISVYASTDNPKKESEEELGCVIDTLKGLFASHFYSERSEKIEEAIQELFIQKGWTLCVAESCTGGAISSRLTKVSDASQYFMGGVVTYSNELKEKFLKVDGEVIAQYGAVSEEVVRAMVLGVQEVIGSDFAVAVSGIAGPKGGSENKPVGTVWVGVVRRGQEPYCCKIQAHGNREMVIERSVNAALGELFKCAKNG